MSPRTYRPSSRRPRPLISVLASLLALACTAALAGFGSPTSASAVTTVWQPTAAKPLSMHWVLGDSLDLNSPVQMGLRDLSGKALPAPDVYDIDLEYNSAATVSALHTQGKKVICYIDVGVYETYRTDASAFRAISPRIWGNADSGWSGSYWLDIRRVAELAPIMKARIQACKDKGFDAVEPDEMTGYSNNPGFPLTYADQLAYNKAVAGWAHDIGISVGMKGDLEQAHDLATYFDWFLVEECYQYSECTSVDNSGPGADGLTYPGVQSFTRLNKAVWVAEYEAFTASRWSSNCANSRAIHVNTARYRLGLPNTGGRQPCATTSATQW
jgi:hypothetical protein